MCLRCESEFRRGGEGGKIRVRSPAGVVSEAVASDLAAAVTRAGSTRAASESGPTQLPEARVLVRFSQGELPVRRSGRLIGFRERMGVPREARLELSADILTLWPGGKGGSAGPVHGVEPLGRWELIEIGAVQTSSNYLQLAIRGEGLMSLRFPQDSPKRWEERLQAAIRALYRETGRGEIMEFQPRVVSAVSSPDSSSPEVIVVKGLGGRGRRIRSKKASLAAEPPFFWYGAMRTLLKPLVALGFRVRVQGLENIPESGPFILIANHQSYLDPVLVQTACPRTLHTFTKSTEFSRPFRSWLLTRLNALPTRRYTVDPQVVRMALRQLDRGEGVCIYPEGERSWDGTVQGFRKGTIRFLLWAGVPVIPCAIDGSFDAWPRWSNRIRRSRIRIFFGEPLCWPPILDRQERYSAVPEAAAALQEALVALGAWSAKSPTAGSAF